MKTELEWLRGYKKFLVENGLEDDWGVVKEVEGRIAELSGAKG